MPKPCLGIDIGASALKLALCAGGQVRRAVSAEMPDNLMRDGRLVSPEATAHLIGETLKKEKLSARRCALVLPAAAVFTRVIAVPAMTRENLALNLPYEFRDFISQEKDKYFYDYAVLDREDGEDGLPRQFELMAAATLKETVAGYADMCRRAGLKLVTAVPEEAAYMNLLRAYMERAGEQDPEREYGFVDLGHTAVRLHIYKGLKHQATRVVEYGAQLLDAAIAEANNVDEHIARRQKHANLNGELDGELCAKFYASVSMELMRALNFYRFNSPESRLGDLYLCGGGSRIVPLVDQLKAELPYAVHPIGELLSGPQAGAEDAALCQTAAGAALQ